MVKSRAVVGKASKRKGSKFEIDICRALTKWVTGKEKPEIFWRSSLSGGRATVAARKGIQSNALGDISAIDARGDFFVKAFFVECKSYRAINFSFILEERGLLLKWWLWTKKQADKAGRIPVVVFKQNGTKTYAMVQHNRKLFAEFDFRNAPHIKIKMNASIAPIYIVPLDTVLRRVAPKQLARSLATSVGTK